MWKKGIHANYTAFVLEVHVKVDEEGVQTFKRPQSEEDLQALEALGPSQGLPESATALFVEALEQESHLQLLAYISALSEKGVDQLERHPDQVKSRIRESVRGVLEAQLKKMLEPIVDNVVERVREGYNDSEPTVVGG